LAYARDLLSHERLLDLAGQQADTSRCRQGVDVAFALRPREALIDPQLAERLGELATITVGVNVSGLLCEAPASERFGLAGDYLGTMTALTRVLIADGAFVVFVPHVHVPGGGGESDMAAISAIDEQLTKREREHTAILPANLDAAEIKWCMAKFDWMVGSRMHSTIGSLSQQVPTFGYAYSDKTAGVFETCGVSDEVADARKVSGNEAVDLMVAAFARRQHTAAKLASTMPAVVDRSRRQLADIIAAVESWRGHGPSGTIG
jgi:polysaccharide pyruvyl transferase WcaK-like protein